jgi:mannose-6-phosphate isomerase-like protein (cupin superfamily)
MLKGLKSCKVIEKPWGKEEIWADCQSYLGKIITIEPNKKLSRQYHVLKEETIRVLSGKLRLEIGPVNSVEIKYMDPGEIFHVTPGTIHRFCAEDTQVKLLEVSTYHPSDVVRIEDDYNR